MPRRLVLPALLAACFTGGALEGEPCRSDADCGPELACSVGGLCGEFLCDDPQDIALENFDPDVFLVVDYAATMRLADLDTGVVRWDLTRALVDRIADELGHSVNLGVQVVPSVDPDADTSPDPCFTSADGLVSPAADRGPAVMSALAPAPAKTGEHALRRGLELALESLAARPGAGMRPQRIVLVSDGPFNCSLAASDPVTRVELFDADLATHAATAAAAGVPVIVVGVDVEASGGLAPAPGRTISEVDRDLAFAQLATAGGQPRAGATPYYTPADVDELLAVLRAVPPAFADCRVTLRHAPDYPPRLAVTVDGHTYKPADACTGAHGWRYVDADHTHIELCPATCEAFRTTRRLTVDHRCPSA